MEGRCKAREVRNVSDVLYTRVMPEAFRQVVRRRSVLRGRARLCLVRRGDAGQGQERQAGTVKEAVNHAFWHAGMHFRSRP